MLVSATRLRLRSWRYLPQMGWWIMRSIQQARSSPGFITGKLLRDAHFTFWTITAWQDEAAMRQYRNSGPHQRVMPKLLDWCDEAVSGHWGLESATLPTWDDAYQRLQTAGKLTKVRHPSPNHTARSFRGPERIHITRELPLSPKHVAP